MIETASLVLRTFEIKQRIETSQLISSWILRSVKRTGTIKLFYKQMNNSKLLSYVNPFSSQIHKIILCQQHFQEKKKTSQTQWDSTMILNEGGWAENGSHANELHSE